MSTRKRFVLGSIVVFLTTAVTAALPRLREGAPDPIIDASSRVFAERLSTYMRLRQRLGQEMPAGELATVLRAARRGSRPGDVVCPDVAGRIRRLVAADFARRNPTDRAAVLAEVPQVPDLHPNDLYPSGLPVATMPAALLQTLGPLPAPLEYRFLGDAVIVLDVDTHLIVDLVPHALPGGR